jgi:hypothetical protein
MRAACSLNFEGVRNSLALTSEIEAQLAHISLLGIVGYRTGVFMNTFDFAIHSNYTQAALRVGSLI